MAEAKDGCAPLKDVDEDTFARFAEFAYTGDYTAGDPEILLDSSQIEAGEDKSDNDDGERAVPDDPPPPPPEPEEWPRADPVASSSSWGSSTVRRSKKKISKKKREYVVDEAPVEAYPEEEVYPVKKPTQASKRDNLWEEFRRPQYSALSPSFQPRENREPCEDYTTVFLSHARLYVFAETYQIEQLKYLVLHKLQQTLLVFTPYEERMGDVADLMQYTYVNTYDGSESMDPLRHLVALYAACMAEKLAGNGEFQDLLKEAGDLANDFVAELVKRLD